MNEAGLEQHGEPGGGRAGESARFCAQCLEFLVKTHPAASAAVARVAVLLEDLDSPVGWPAGAPPTDSLVAVARLAGRARKPVRADGESGAKTFALPLLAEGRVVGCAAFALRAGATDMRDVELVLTVGAAWLARTMTAGAAWPDDAQATLLPLLAAFQAGENLAARVQALVDTLASAFGCERVAFLRLSGRGKPVLAAVSGARRYGARTPLGHRLRHDVARHLADAGEGHGGRTEAAAGGQRIVPLVSDGRPVAALVFERGGSEALSEQAQRRIEALVSLLTDSYCLARRAERDPVHRGARLWGRLAGRRPRALLTAAALIALAAFALTPGPYRIKSVASIEGETQRALVAPADAFIEAAHVVAGDEVVAGTPMVAFAADDLRLQQVKWASERARATSARRDAAARQERGKLRVLEAQIAHANAELELVQAHLARLELAAPIDGVVVSGDLGQRLGGPVRRGEVLFEIVPHGAFRLALLIDEHDVNDVQPGMTGALKLNAFPAERLPFTVVRVTSLSEVNPDGNHFIAYAEIAETDLSLRPGMAGVTRIDAGERTRLAGWTRALRLWLAFEWWRWFG